MSDVRNSGTHHKLVRCSLLLGHPLTPWRHYSPKTPQDFRMRILRCLATSDVRTQETPQHTFMNSLRERFSGSGVLESVGISAATKSVRRSM